MRPTNSQDKFYKTKNNLFNWTLFFDATETETLTN